MGEPGRRAGFNQQNPAAAAGRPLWWGLSFLAFIGPLAFQSSCHFASINAALD